MVAASGRRCGRVKQHLEAVRLRHEALSQPRIIGHTTRYGLLTDPRPLCLLFLIGGIVLLCGRRLLEEDSISTLFRLGYYMLTRNDNKSRCSHAPARQRPSIDKPIATRYGRAQRRRRRVRKRRESITTQFNRLFKVVLDRRTSTATRTALVRALIPLAHHHEESALDSHQGPRFRKNVHPTKALRFAVSKCLDSMPDEDNPKVRSFLLRLLAISNFFSVWTYPYNTETDQKIILEVLEQAHITEHEKFFALSLYFKYGKENAPFGNAELATRMIHMCVRTISQDNAQGRITDPALKCLLHEIRHNRRDESDIHPIVRDDIVMRTVFGSISPSSNDYKMKLHSKLLLNILHRAGVADRAYLLTVYASQLEQALSILPIYHYDNFNLLIHSDIVNLLVNIKFFMSELAYMLYYWRDAVRNSFYGKDPSIYIYRFAQYCRAARRVLSAMEGNDEKMQEILGYGLLPGVAAHVDQAGADPSVMQIYRRILDVYPEWTGRFCEAVRGGEITNAATMHGRNLERVEKKTRAAYYYLEEPQLVSDHDENPLTDVPPTTQPITIVLRNKDVEPEFSDLPMHFLVQVARTMTLKELGHFRLSCTKAFEAVTDILGGSRRTLEIKRLVCDLWTKRVHFTDDPYYDSLHGVQKQVAIFAGWLGHDEIGSIDFRGVDTMSCAQLEACFGTEPRPSVKQLNVVGTVVMPTVWSTLARLFPSVTIVHCTENACRFPDSIVREEGDTIGGCALKDGKELEESGRLDSQRIAILRSLRSLFPDAQCIYIE